MSDVTRARQTGATALPRTRLATDKAEGRFLGSTASDKEWFGISKVPLTTCLSCGKHALITDVPPLVIEVLSLACPELLVVVSRQPPN